MERVLTGIPTLRVYVKTYLAPELYGKALWFLCPARSRAHFIASSAGGLLAHRWATSQRLFPKLTLQEKIQLNSSEIRRRAIVASFPWSVGHSRDRS